MNGIFDALFSPKRYFHKTSESYLGSFLSLILIILVNEISYLSFLYRIIGFYGLSGILFLVLIPLLVYFILTGLDLILIKEDKDHWFKTHLALTYTPYIFLPLVIPMVIRSGWVYMLFGWIMIFLLCLWSFSLLKMICKNKLITFIRLLRDFVFIMLFVFIH